MSTVLLWCVYWVLQQKNVSLKIPEVLLVTSGFKYLNIILLEWYEKSYY